MKKAILILSMVAIAFSGNAQGKWQIKMNKKVILTASAANDSANTKKIKQTEWKANGFLEVSYTETQSSSWHHSLHFADEAGNDLLVKDSTQTAKISLASLRKLFAGKKTIKIYLTISPPNPMMMAPSRMVTLAILKLP
jgi:hypothetical protein